MELYRKPYYARPLLYYWAILLNIGLLFLCFAGMDSDAYSQFFDKGNVYLPAVYHTLFGGMQEVQLELQAAPSFFPDMPFYFFFYFISGESVSITALLYGLLQYAALSIVIVRFMKMHRREVSWSSLAIVQLLLALFPLAYLVNGEYQLFFYLLSAGNHAGAFIIGLWCFDLTLSYLREQRQWKFILLLVYVFLTTLSDRLFLVIFPIPLLTTLFLRGIKPLRAVWFKIWWGSAVAALLGLLSFGLFRWLAGSPVPSPKRYLDFNFIGESFRVFCTQMKEYLLSFNTVSLILLLVITSAVIMLVRQIYSYRSSFENHQKEKAMQVLGEYFLFSAALILLIAPLLAGNYANEQTLRYNIYFMHFFIIAYISFLPGILSKRMLVWRTLPVVFLLLLATVFFVIHASRLGFGGLTDFLGYPVTG